MSDDALRKQSQLLTRREAELVALRRQHEQVVEWWGTFQTLASGLDERSDEQSTCDRWCEILIDELEFPAAAVLRLTGDTLTCVAWPAHLGPRPAPLVDPAVAAALRAEGSGLVNAPEGPLAALAGALRFHRFLWAVIGGGPGETLVEVAGFDAQAARYRGGFEAADVEQFRWVARHLETVLRNVLLVRKVADHERVQQMLATVQQQREELERRLETITRQAETIRGLSSPVIEVWDGVLALPLIGEIDPARMRDVTENVLERLVATRARRVILDLTGVLELDVVVVDFLVQLGRAVALLGGRCLVTGMRPAVAAAVAARRGGIGDLLAFRDLRAGLRHCIAGQ